MGKFAPSASPPPIPPAAPEREDPDIAKAAKEQSLREKRRKGRRANVIFGDQPEAELGGGAAVQRPTGGAKVLGGTA